MKRIEIGHNEMKNDSTINTTRSNIKNSSVVGGSVTSGTILSEGTASNVSKTRHDGVNNSVGNAK